MEILGYRALREATAWRELAGRGKIRVLGEDRARLLHAMTTNHIDRLTPGTGCYAYFLSALGRILAGVNVFRLEDSILLDTDPETRTKVFEHLDRYIIADDVTLEDKTEAWPAIAIEGPRAPDTLCRLGATIPETDLGIAPWRGNLVARTTFTGSLGVFIFVRQTPLAELVEEIEHAGATQADAEAFELVRIENGRPRYGPDLSERFLAQEANQPRALNFNKGCYLGQEIVERVRSRGQVHRLLVPVEIETDSVPPPGTKLMDGAASLAEITSSAYSPALNRVVALAYVRADRAKPGTELPYPHGIARVRGLE